MTGHDDDDALTALLVPTPIEVLHRALNRYYDNRDSGELGDGERAVSTSTAIGHLISDGEAMRYVTGKTGIPEAEVLRLMEVHDDGR